MDRYSLELAETRRAAAAIRVTDTRAVPFRWICSIAVALRVTSGGGSQRRTGLKPLGSGVLISPCHVLTAAHLLRSREERGSVVEHQEAEDVWVSIARDEDTKPFGELQATSWTIHPRWNPDRPVHNWDYALITLGKPVADGCHWGHAKCGAGMSLDPLPDALASAFIDGQAMSAGYPGSKNHQLWCEKGVLSSGNGDLDAQLRRSGQLRWVRNAALFYLNVPSERGQSGSPVWILNGGRRYVIGVAIEADGCSTIAVLVNDAVRRQLRDWMSSTVCRRAESLVEESETRAAFEQETPPPAGVPRFEHFYQPMKADVAGTGWTADGSEKRLSPINPGFIDASDNLVTSSLQSDLAALLVDNDAFSKYLSEESRRSRRGHNTDKIHAAVVDLTGKKMTSPEFAGWASTVAVNAGSAIKVAVLYGIYQLKADLQHVAKTEAIGRAGDLAAFADKHWRTAGIAARPRISDIFDLDHDPPALAFTDEISKALDNIVFHEANVASSVLIEKLGFQYIASAIWRSGLRHPSRGGIWLMWNFDSDRPQQWDGAPEPAPGPVYPHTATALSLATFYTLIAQARLPTQDSSAEMRRRLTETWYTDLLPGASITAKVGLDLRCLVSEKRAGGKSICTRSQVLAAQEGDFIVNGSCRYAVALITKGIHEGIHVLGQLIVEIDKLIRKRN